MSRLTFAGRRSSARLSVRSIIRGAFAACMVLAMSAASGCGDETGIVIEVSKDDQIQSLEFLEFHIGVAGELDVLVTPLPGCNSNAAGTYYVETATEAERVIKLDGQDIASDPYRLLLRPGDVEDDAELMVLVIGKQAEGDVAGNAVGIAQLETPVSFIEGKALRWELILSAPAGEFSAGNGCFCGPGGAIVTPDDPDCDGAVGDQDCAPTNGFIGPDVPERCDGVDNDCNPNTQFQGTTECYTQEGDSCFYGTRSCNDSPTNAGSPFGSCVREGDLQVDMALCRRFEQCPEGPEQFECANRQDGDNFRKAQCELLVTQDGELCPDHAVVLSPAGVNVAEGALCTWTLLGGLEQDPFGIHLKKAALDQPLPQVIACEPIFSPEEVTTTPDDPTPDGTMHLVFDLLEDPYFEVWEVHIDTQRVEVCPEPNELRPGLRCDVLENAPAAAR